MPIYNHTCLSEFIGNVRSNDETSYANAVTSVLGTLNGVSATGSLGWTKSSVWTVNQPLCRFDLRGYKGAKATAVTFKLDTQWVTRDSGGTADLTLRAHSRFDPNGLLDDTKDWKNATLMAAAEEYCEYPNLAANGSPEILTFTNTGTALLDAINLAVEGDGILDTMLVDDRMASGTPPAVPTNQDYVQLNGSWQAYKWKAGPGDNAPRLEITWEFEGIHIVPQVNSPTVGDIFAVGVSDTSWSTCLNGPANVSRLEALNLGEDIGCWRFLPTYKNMELFFRLDTSVIDGGKGIRDARLVISGNGGGAISSEMLPWHVLRHDWSSGPSLSQYLTQAQLILLTKVGEFEFQEYVTQDYPPSDDESNTLWKLYVPLDQAFIDAILEGNAETGFVICNERMITGVAPAVDDIDQLKLSLTSEDIGGHVGIQVVIQYDDGSLFFGSVF